MREKKFKSKLKFKKEERNPEVELLKSQLARALADYDNLQKRVAVREEQQRFIIKAQVLGRLLPVFDMLYGAQEHLNDSGLALTIKELEDTLSAEGIEAIVPEEGELFSEELHEATEVVNNSNLKDEQVAECVTRGWKFVDGDVIRHAKVKVNKQSLSSSEDKIGT
jgi:molecular chaperone GrpE